MPQPRWPSSVGLNPNAVSAVNQGLESDPARAGIESCNSAACYARYSELDFAGRD